MAKKHGSLWRGSYTQSIKNLYTVIYEKAIFCPMDTLLKRSIRETIYLEGRKILLKLFFYEEIICP